MNQDGFLFRPGACLRVCRDQVRDALSTFVQNLGTSKAQTPFANQPEGKTTHQNLHHTLTDSRKYPFILQCDQSGLTSGFVR